MKIRASENPDRRERTRTIGSVKNILNGRIQVTSTSLAENLSLKGTSSSGPQTLAVESCFLRFFAILFNMMVVRVSGTVKKCSACTAPPVALLLAKALAQDTKQVRTKDQLNPYTPGPVKVCFSKATNDWS